MTEGTSTSFGLQFAVRRGPDPEKYAMSKVSRQNPLSSCTRPSRHVTRFDTAYGIEYDGNDDGGVVASADCVNACQISAGNVPPATGSPWYSVSIGRSRVGYPT